MGAMMDILLVDDEEGIRKVLGISLADRGYRVHAAAGGGQALELFKAVRPRIVLSDIKMPGMDGLDLLKALKRIDPDTEIIMITGHGDIDLAIKSLKFEAIDFITKPIDEDILDVALKRAVERIDLRTRLKAYTENLEQLVEEKSRRLIQAERLAVMGETVAGLAHAIKNIAGGLKGGAFVVEKGLSLDNSQYLEEGWRMVRDNVERIQQLALDLLNIAKPGVPNLRPTDPNQPLKAVFQLMQPQAAQSGIDMALVCTPDPAPDPMEPEGVHRCLLNLAGNALDACGQCASARPAPQITLACKREGAWLVYEVRDHCGGMDAAVKEKLFQGFFTTKGSRGTGIGLMLTRKIAEAHGGEILVDTAEGVGSTFEIRLPLGSRDSAQAADRPSSRS
ncbi:MAG: hybrid sensor histidine kinase/response regulator [Desulfosarcinaceae bacterium]